MTARRETAIVLVRDLAFAYVEGRKTQTRRLVKPQPSDPTGVPGAFAGDLAWPISDVAFTISSKGPPDEFLERCPYGVPGDRLRMLTGWATDARFDEVEPSQLPADARVWSWFDGREKPEWAGRLRMARHLPKRLRAAMPIAEVVSVRVERLNEISEADAIAEGAPFTGSEASSSFGVDALWFPRVWDSINAAKHPWSSNPFVWVVEFKRLEAGHG